MPGRKWTLAGLRREGLILNSNFRDRTNSSKTGKGVGGIYRRGRGSNLWHGLCYKLTQYTCVDQL
jgi:hypothetical protein